jgi:hypothetical protein
MKAVTDGNDVHGRAKIAALRSYHDLMMGPLYRHPDVERLGLSHPGMTAMPVPVVSRTSCKLRQLHEHIEMN